MQRRKFLTALGGAVTTAAFAGCGGGGEESQAPTYGTQSTEISGEPAATIELTSTGFEPVESESVPVDAPVEFVNTTDVVKNLHDDVAGDLHSWNLEYPEWQPGESVYFTFSEAGVYAFRDKAATRFQACGAIPVGEEYTTEDIPNLPCTEEDSGFTFGGDDSGNSTDGNSTNSTDGNA